MQPTDILRHRLHNQHLTRPKLAAPGEMVAWLGAVQSQDYPSAKWALGQRLKNANDDAIERAFTAGRLLRTHVMRPTWHFVAPADIRWLLALTGPRVNAVSAYYYRQAELDGAVFKRSHASLTRALRDGQFLTRAELAATLKQNGIHRTGLGLAYIIMRAELDGVICSGPRRGKQFTYALLEERVPPARPVDHDEALAELAQRYFASHGPAILQDFVWWSGLTGAQARLGIELAQPRLEHELIGGKSHWFVAARPPAIPASAYLLPNYDEYTIAYKDRDAFYPPPKVKQPVTRSNAPFNHMIVIGGRIVGAWNRTISKRAVSVETRFFKAPSADEQSAVTQAVDRLAKFLGLPAEY